MFQKFYQNKAPDKVPEQIAPVAPSVGGSACTHNFLSYYLVGATNLWYILWLFSNYYVIARTGQQGFYVV